MLSRKLFEAPVSLLEQAAVLSPKMMAVVGAAHPTALLSARMAADAGLIEPVLVGDRREIEDLAVTTGWDLSGVRIVHAVGEMEAAATAVALARHDKVQALMKGHLHTDTLMRAVVRRDTGLRTGRRLSHIFHMTVPDSDRVLYITDAAINVAPDADALIDIVSNAVRLAHVIGTETPKVALLSATETPMEAMPSSVRAREVVSRAVAGAVGQARVDGPFALDNALSSEAARQKCINSPVAGAADIVVVPNIETGNALFKAMVYMMSAVAAGVVMGARVPIVLTSRADPPEARLAATAVAAIAAQA